MKLINSTKTWYGKYSYKLVLYNVPIYKLRGWLIELGIDHSVRYHSCSKTCMVFITRPDDMEKVANAFATYVIEKHSPASAAVARFMELNSNVEIRKNLLYKKFRYRISFRYQWGDVGSTYMMQWIEDRLDPKDGGETWACLNNRYYPRLYLTNDSDMMMLSMSADPDKIKKIVTIRLLSEIS